MRVLFLGLLAGFVLSSAPAATAQNSEPVFYITQYRIQPERMDSLSALVARYDVPWHNYVAQNVAGYQRWYYRHDTGNEYNFMIVTRYPDWDMVRGDEIPFDDLFPAFASSVMGMTMAEVEADEERVNQAFRWAYEGSTHIDQIWRPISAEGDD